MDTSPYTRDGPDMEISSDTDIRYCKILKSDTDSDTDIQYQYMQYWSKSHKQKQIEDKSMFILVIICFSTNNDMIVIISTILIQH